PHIHFDTIAVSAELPILSLVRSKVCVVLSNFHKSGTVASMIFSSIPPLQSSLGGEQARCKACNELEESVRSRISPQYFSERRSKSQSGVWPRKFGEGPLLQ
ncbi:hypothetical protein GWI33_000369, partial [Rhynchophorus ferrugineus]